MTKKQIEVLTKKLLSMKEEIINGGFLNKYEDLHVSTDDLSDEADLASSVVEQQVSFNMRQRELSKLASIEEALHRIELGTYSECEDCGEDIGFKRLDKRPFTSLCITHAEEAEREQQRYLKHG